MLALLALPLPLLVKSIYCAGISVIPLSVKSHASLLLTLGPKHTGQCENKVKRDITGVFIRAQIAVFCDIGYRVYRVYRQYRLFFTPYQPTSTKDRRLRRLTQQREPEILRPSISISFCAHRRRRDAAAGVLPASQADSRQTCT